MHKIKSVGVMSVGKVYGIAGAVIGLIVGVFYGLFGILFSIIALASSDNTGAALMGLVLSVVAMVVTPLAAGAMYFVFGLIAALIMNLVLKYAGGLEIELEAPLVYQKPMM